MERAVSFGMRLAVSPVLPPDRSGGVVGREAKL
jgi:hypothetical protein